MSEADSTPRRRPPTIDLTATEIEAESPQSQSTETGHAADSNSGQDASNLSRAGPWRHALSAAAGAVLVGALALGLWFSGLVPPREAVTVPSRNAVGDLGARLDKIEAELQSRPNDAALASRVDALATQMKALGDSLAAVNRRLDEIAVAAKSASQRADAANQAAKDAEQTAKAAAGTAEGATQSAAQNSVTRSDLDALANRLATLDRSVKALSESTQHAPAATDDRAARAAVAAEALRATVERGAPYQAELEAAKSLGADPASMAALEPFAASGVPTAAELAGELSRLNWPRQASVAHSTDGTFLGRLENGAKGLVRITPVDAPALDNDSAAIARVEADASRDDISAALADIAGLPQSARTLAESWVQKAKARAAAIAASRRIAADALAGLGSTNTQ